MSDASTPDLRDDFPRGRFVWCELLTDDPETSRDFYAEVVGWDTEEWTGGGSEPYVMWAHDGETLGGIQRIPPDALAGGARPHWLPYVAVADVDATAARAQERGGRVLVAPMDIPTVGRMAVLADPQGALFALYAPAGEVPGHDGAPRVGEFSWYELATSDQEAAFDFYRELFGWHETDSMDMGEGGLYRMYGRQGHDLSLGGMYDKPAEMPGPPAWLVYARVADLERALAKVEALGGRIANGPLEVPGGGRVAQCVDPRGAAFALHWAAP